MLMDTLVFEAVQTFSCCLSDSHVLGHVDWQWINWETHKKSPHSTPHIKHGVSYPGLKDVFRKGGAMFLSIRYLSDNDYIIYCHEMFCNSFISIL